MADQTAQKIKPSLTEKSNRLAAAKPPVYVFTIDRTLNKVEVKKLIRQRYGVTPVKVAIINLPKKPVSRRGGLVGQRGGSRKTLVYLKTGETINLA